MSGDKARVVVVTGLSGAGKSTALHSLEDLGHFCVDNLPPQLLASTVEMCEKGDVERVAIGIDVRVGAFLEGAVAAIRELSATHDVIVLFLDASDEALIRRFSETRRPHPLARFAAASGGEPNASGLGAVAVLDGVQLERERLAGLRAGANVVIDTTHLNVHELRRQVVAHLGPGKGEEPRMIARFVSFGFKYGLPVDADVVLDVRHLDNPFFVPDLRPLPGTDPRVAAHVLGHAETIEFLRRAEELLAWSLPRYEREGKSYLTVAIGCTGGRHRSVVVAAELAAKLGSIVGLPVSVVHRDVARAEPSGTAPRNDRGASGSAV